jgi:hypothetical protein
MISMQDKRDMKPFKSDEALFIMLALELGLFVVIEGQRLSVDTELPK